MANETLQSDEDQIRVALHRLEAANENLEQLWERFGFSDAALRDWSEAHQAVLTLERELASLRSEEHAVPSDFPFRWDIGAPLPQLLRDEHKTLLAFLAADRREWDGHDVEIVNKREKLSHFQA